MGKVHSRASVAFSVDGFASWDGIPLLVHTVCEILQTGGLFSYEVCNSRFTFSLVRDLVMTYGSMRNS